MHPFILKCQLISLRRQTLYPPPQYLDPTLLDTLTKTTHYSAIFRANWFKFGMQVQNYILKGSEYRKRGECERNAICRVEYSIDISGRKCGPIEISLKRVSFCVCDDYKPNYVIMKEGEHHTCQFGMFTNQQCNISGISAGKTAGHGAQNKVCVM